MKKEIDSDDDEWVELPIKPGSKASLAPMLGLDDDDDEMGPQPLNAEGVLGGMMSQRKGSYLSGTYDRVGAWGRSEGRVYVPFELFLSRDFFAKTQKHLLISTHFCNYREYTIY